VNRALQHEDYEALFSLQMASSYRQNTSENCSIYTIIALLMTRRNPIPLASRWLPTMQCHIADVLLLTSPIHRIPWHSIQKELKLSHYLIWWVGTGLQKHTTSTSSGLLKIEAVLSSEALIAIYQTPWCPKPGNIIWIFTTVKTRSKECKNINYHGWMFHYEKKRNYKYIIMFLYSHYKSGHFLSLKWNKKAKISRYFLVTNIITTVYHVSIPLMLAEVNYKRKQTKNSPRWKTTTDKINAYVWLCLTCALILLVDQQQTTMNWHLIIKI